MGLKDYFIPNNTQCRFISAEPMFREINSDKKIYPDIVFQCNDDSFGVICEIKTSLPESDEYLKNDLKQLENYSGKIMGWDTSDCSIKDHGILLLCHAQDSDRVVKKIDSWLKEGTLKITKKIAIAEWSMMRGFRDPRDIFLLKFKYGTSGCKLLDDELNKNIAFDAEELTIKYNVCRFTRKEPPVDYIMAELWSSVFPAIDNTGNDFNCNIDDILEITYEYFIPWSNIKGQYSQVRKRWVQKAMKAFCELNLADLVDEKIGEYKIYYGKHIPKNITDYFIEKMCQKYLPIGKTLDDFKNKKK